MEKKDRGKLSNRHVIIGIFAILFFILGCINLILNQMNGLEVLSMIFFMSAITLFMIDIILTYEEKKYRRDKYIELESGHNGKS